MTSNPLQAAATGRREFLRGGLRWALLAGLAALSGLLAKRPGAVLPGQTCIGQGLCRGCGAFADCGLPQALSAKQVLRNARRPRRESAQNSKQERGVHAASTSNSKPAMKRTEVRAPEARYET
jgi:hypothetical protein